MNFSENLSLLRIKSKMTQAELAEKLKISRSAVGMYEQGARVPDFEILERIADLFNVDMMSLLGYTPGSFRTEPQIDPAQTPAEQYDERTKEIVEMLMQLTPQEKDFILAQLKGILSSNDRLK